MSQVYLFPGQGSQFRGMGKELFPYFPEILQRADDLLGYSVETLCLQDPDRVLAQTQFTQPALYVVNALAWYQCRQTHAAPDYLAGHSLGEFNALLAAGAYDFETGLSIVEKRGQLMSQATGGAMAAVLGLELSAIEELLRVNSLITIDIANVNSNTQIVLSGLSDDLNSAASLIESAGAKYIPLNVSAPFHSRYMQKAQGEFSEYLNTLSFKPLQRQVISNWSADSYPETDYLENITRQLVSPVRWYQSVSRLISAGCQDFEELGPGNVLTRLLSDIKSTPVRVESAKLTSDLRKSELKNLLMFSGQGHHYRTMGRDLYQNNPLFKSTMDRCNTLVESVGGLGFINELYNSTGALAELSDIRITYPAIFSFEYSLVQVLVEDAVEVDAVLGYGLGEYVAATVAGSLTLEDALTTIVHQASCFLKVVPGGAMLSVLADIEHYDNHLELYSSADVAVSNPGQFVVSGDKLALALLQQALDAQDIPSMFLPVEHGLGSREMTAAETEFRQCFEGIDMKTPSLPVYSSTQGERLNHFSIDHFWSVTRQQINFSPLVNAMDNKVGYRFIDCSPTGSLSQLILQSQIPVSTHAFMHSAGRNHDNRHRQIDALTADTSPTGLN